MQGTDNEVGRLLIIDDEEEMGNLEPYVVRTDFQTGITSDTVQERNTSIKNHLHKIIK
jgi:hypothetical protein